MEGGPSVVLVHIYDVTGGSSAKSDEAIVKFNNLTRNALGVGGVFHSGVEVYGEEWSFGQCRTGSGVFCIRPKSHSQYTYRETLVLGRTLLDPSSVALLLAKLRREWKGTSYHLLTRNCNHFGDLLCRCLGVGELPWWVNRFAASGDSVMEMAAYTVESMRVLQGSATTAVSSALDWASACWAHPPKWAQSRDSHHAQQHQQQQLQELRLGLAPVDLFLKWVHNGGSDRRRVGEAVLTGRFRKDDLPSDFSSLPPEAQEAIERMVGNLSVGICHAALEEAWSREESIKVMLQEAAAMREGEEGWNGGKGREGVLLAASMAQRRTRVQGHVGGT